MTALTTPSCCNACTRPSVCQLWSSTGSIRSCPAVLSRSHTSIGDVRCSIWGSTGLSAWAAVVRTYILYTAELAHVVARQGLSLHQYADDCQVYTSSPVDGAGVAVDQLSTCLVNVEARCKPVVTVLTRVKHRSCSWILHNCFPDSA